MQPATSPERKQPSQQGRKSILGRLSLSPASRRRNKTDAETAGVIGAPMPPIKNASLVSGGRAGDRYPQTPSAFAGPSYESMSPSPPPKLASPSLSQGYQHSAPTYVARAMPGEEYQRKKSGGASVGAVQDQQTGPAQIPAEARISTQQMGSSTSPLRTRNPIYPALASPPRDYRAVASSSSPPNVGAVQGVHKPAGLKVNTVLPVVHSRTHSSSRTVTRASSVSPTEASRNMHIIASSRVPPHRQLSQGNSGNYVSPEKHSRPSMSTRKSAASSSRTITSPPKGVIIPPLPYSTPASPTATRRPTLSDNNSRQSGGLSEASAYAKAMASSLARSESSPAVPISSPSPVAKSPEQTRADRPLPRPPGYPMESHPSVPRFEDLSIRSDENNRNEAGQSVRDHKSSFDVEPGTSHTLLSPLSKSPSRQASSPSNDRSGFVPPRRLTGQSSSRGHQTLPETPAISSHVRHSPERLNTKRDGDGSGTALAPRKINGAILQRPAGPLDLDFLLAHPAIQSSILGAININTFLSLSGSSESVRRQFTGESIGRWVLREWAVLPPEPAGTRWPNLTVWEGFLESLLHDPATYSTYPSRWHNLLRHLSLSHTLVVLYLRSLPASCFPNHSLLPFEDDGMVPSSLPFSPSSASLSSIGQPRSRVGSTAGSDVGSVSASRAPRRERVVEIIMPEPLAAKPHQEMFAPEVAEKPMRRRGSISSLASVASFSFSRKRSNSLAVDARHSGVGYARSMAEPAASLAPGKAGLPPVSYPSAKRYGFRNNSEASGRKRVSSESRPGSVFSFQTSPSMASYMPRASQIGDPRHADRSDSAWPLQAPPPIGVRPQSSFGSTDSNRRSDRGSPVPGRKQVSMGSQRCEPAFDKPMPYIPGRAPVLRVFVPLSDRVRRWPSAEGAAAAVEELEKCGALKRMRLGDLIVNTAIRAPKTTEHVLLFVPFVKHMLVPLQYAHLATGHLPAYVDAFALPPSYYYPFLPAPQIIFLNLGPYRDQGLKSMRLASDRRDMTIASGSRISAKRFLYVTGVEIGPSNKTAPEWHGMVSLEAEGTAEGKAELERRFGSRHAAEAPLAPWEIVKEKSMGGTVWLRLTKEK